MEAWVCCFYIFAGHSIMGLVVLIAQMIKSNQGGKLQDAESSYILGMVFLGGLISTASIFTITCAFAIGPAGPVSAIGQNSAIVLLFLQWGILGITPIGLEVGGMVISIVGVVTLALGSDLIQKNTANGVLSTSLDEISSGIAPHTLTKQLVNNSMRQEVISDV